MLGSDERLYVVKFQNNPQHIRVLANELLATRLAQAVGLTVPNCEVVEVNQWLISTTPELDMDFGSRRTRCLPGLQFGSQFAGGLMPRCTLDSLPEDMLVEVRNLREFAGILALDKWTGNVDGRQAVFSKKTRERRYLATFIDQGYCFNAAEWRFEDAPLKGVYARKSVYAEVWGWESFEPWLGRLESFSPEKLWNIAATVPTEWYGGKIEAIERLMEQLLVRRAHVRELIGEFRDCDRMPFPKWTKYRTVRP